MPVFSIMADNKLVLFPGAAHASITSDPLGGDRTKGGIQLALSLREMRQLPLENIIIIYISLLVK
jgi:hypothetical protein